MNDHEMFDKTRLEHIGEMRERFFETGSIRGITGVRPEILECWKMAYEAGLHTTTMDKPRLSEKDFDSYKERSKQLMKVAVPYMKRLAGFLKKDCFWVTLMDDLGNVLKIVGSETSVRLANETFLYEGSFRGLNVACGGLLQACWYFDKPFQIIGTENSLAVDDDYAGAASPIYDKESGNRLGVISIAGYWWESHTHTLGLVIMAAEAISQQIALIRKNETLQLAGKKLDTALEATNIGIVYFSKDGTIQAANSMAIQLLRGGSMTKEEFMKVSVFSYLEGCIHEANVDTVLKKIEMDGEFVCDLTPPKRFSALHCVIRIVSKDEDTFIMQIQRQEDLNRFAADTATSGAVFTMDHLIGDSDEMRAIKEKALAAAAYSPSTMILGESGTGKELLAQAIHNASPRAKGPFIAVNCGAIPKSLLESELFGYEAGAFTGAQKNGKPGKFELANKGTLFLDEIGDMPYEAQVSLLRALQTKEIVRVGGKKPIKIDIMVISATHQNLEKLISDSMFREDLYYRLNVFSLQMPPLRKRTGDVECLTRYYLDKYATTFNKKIDGISSEALNALNAYHWPGNVRELENAIERAMIVCRSSVISLNDLPERIAIRESLRNSQVETMRPSVGVQIMEEIARNQQQSMDEEELLRQNLMKYGGNLSKVAKAMNISRPTLYRKLKKYGLYDKLHHMAI